MATTVALMVILFLLSNLVLYHGLLPLSTVLPQPRFSRSLFYLLILPGTVIHELSHLIACLASRVRVYEVHLFDPQENGVVGQVVYERCDVLRRNVIAFAPFLGGSLALYLITNYAFPGTRAPDLARIVPSPQDPLGGLATALGVVVSLFASIDLSRPASWVFLYLIFSVGYGIAPSKSDLSHVIADGLLLLGLSAGLYLADAILRLGLMESDLVNGAAWWLAVVLQRVSTLLLFSGIVIGLGAVVLVPGATLLRQVGQGLRQR